jgi:hypothetical protein
MTQEIIVFVIMAFAAAIVIYKTVNNIRKKIKTGSLSSAAAAGSSCSDCSGCSGCSIKKMDLKDQSL